jgi:alkylation response protein AidB-like acyl-CoA dehydrogenase
MELWPPYVDMHYVEELRLFAREHIAPVADEIDREDVYPSSIIKELARRGLTSITLPRDYDGAGKSYGHAAALFEEVSYGSAAVGISLITIFQAQTIINLFGNEALKQEYLPKFAQGLICSYALTEAGHGSDIRTLDTKAVRKGDSWVLTGEKSFITSGSAAEFFLILAETPLGVSAFAVPAGIENLATYVGANSATFGLRNGPHVNLVLNGVRVPLHYLIGEEGKGVKQAVTTLNFSRTLAAAISVGIARAAFDAALQFAAKRLAFDRRVFEFQGIQWYFSDMLSEIDAARLLIYRAAESLDRREEMERYGSEAKLMASKVGTRVASLAVQICGAYGTMQSAPFGRFLRDAKAYEIAGGSTEILRNTIAKYLLRGVQNGTH